MCIPYLLNSDFKLVTLIAPGDKAGRLKKLSPKEFVQLVTTKCSIFVFALYYVVWKSGMKIVNLHNTAYKLI